MTKSNVIIDTEKQIRTLRTPHDVWQTIASFTTVEGHMMEVYAEITGVINDRTSSAKWAVEGLFYRNAGGDVTPVGSVNKPKVGSLGGGADVDMAVNTDNQTIELKVKGADATVINWECSTALNRRRDIGDYSDDPRMQLTIVGMAAAKKTGFLGLQDGLNYVLVPDNYLTNNSPSSPIVQSEFWGISVYKEIYGSSYTEFLNFKASRYGSSTSITASLSRGWLRWWTGTGDFGEGTATMQQKQVSFTTGITGYLKNRVMFGTFKSAEGVSFIWGKHDPTGWANYP